MSTNVVLKEIIDHTETLRRQHVVSPGQEQRFSEGAAPGDEIWQGDLGITYLGSEMPAILDAEHVAAHNEVVQARRFNNTDFSSMPTTDDLLTVYEKLAHINKIDLKLVPGGEDGSRHRLDDRRGVKMYRPFGWGQPRQRNPLEGPIMLITEERRVLHDGAGKHGTVVLPAGFYQFTYQQVQRQGRSARSLD